MALISFPEPVNLQATTSLVTILTGPPAGYIETFNLTATLISGITDAMASVYLEDTVGANDGYIRWNELIKYGAAGGSPDLLVGYRLHNNYNIQIEASADNVVNFHIWNRVRKKIA